MAVANLGSAALPVEGEFQFQNNPRRRRVIFPGANQPRVRVPTGLTGLGTCVDPPRLGRVWAGNPPRGANGVGPQNLAARV